MHRTCISIEILWYIRSNSAMTNFSPYYTFPSCVKDHFPYTILFKKKNKINFFLGNYAVGVLFRKTMQHVFFFGNLLLSLQQVILHGRMLRFPIDSTSYGFLKYPKIYTEMKHITSNILRFQGSKDRHTLMFIYISFCFELQVFFPILLYITQIAQTSIVKVA